MPPDRELLDAAPGETPTHEIVQQLIEAERGYGTQGIKRSWRASDSDRVVLTSDASGVKISRDNGTTAPAQVVVDGTPAGGALTGTYPNPTVSTAGMDALIPPGTVWVFAGSVVPAGWLLCNGQEVAQTTYPQLFAAIGTLYGSSSPTTSFRLPNLQGRVVVGVSGAFPLTLPGGDAAGPAHTHGLNGHTHGSAGHDHAMTNHDHTLSNHTHGASALDVGGSTGASSSTNGLYLAGGATATTVAHTHDKGTLDVTGTTDAAPGSTSGATNYSGGLAVTGPTTPGVTGGPSVGVVDTAGAAYGATATTANMQPFLSLFYIIRGG